MDDYEDLRPSEFVTDTDDQDSLDERIDSEQRLRNQQLWASFQNAACCITKLYKDRAQPNVSLWIPFQNAASNLTTLYKDCIESQRRFAKIGYQIGTRKRLRDFRKILKKHQSQVRSQQPNSIIEGSDHNSLVATEGAQNVPTIGIQASYGQQHQQQNPQQNTVASILAVNQLNIDCDEAPSHSMQAQPIFAPEKNHQPQHNSHHNHQQSQQILPVHQQHLSNNTQVSLSNNEDDLVTFQQALVQPAVVRSIKSGQNKRSCLNPSGYVNNRAIDPTKTEEERLLELNQFLSEEYHRHVGSKKRSCSAAGGNTIKRVRE